LARSGALVVLALSVAQAPAFEARAEIVCVVEAGGTATGRVVSMHDLPGGVLIQGERGWFRYDPAAARVVEAGGTATGYVGVMRDLPGGGVLIQAEHGLFRYDPAAARVVEAGGAATGRVDSMRDLPGGGVLIQAERGLFLGSALPLGVTTPVLPFSPPRLDRARPSEDRISITVALRHPCASVAGNLGLSLVAEGPDRPPQVTPARLAHSSPVGPETALLVGEFQFDRPGEWILALRQGATPVGAALRFSVGAPTFVEQLLAAWQWVAGGFALLYTAAFAALLLATRRSAMAFRILADAVWAKWLTWPFFFLRHVPAVQRWVLEPWFQNVRQAVRRGVSHLDPPVTAADGTTDEASHLLSMLRERPRVWLQGRSGMGKSSVFAAWERTYFPADENATLADAVRRFGFILVMLPVRHYAALQPPEPNRPETWVVEAVRRRFEMFMLGDVEHALVRSMLKAGHIALALDGMNEADRDSALSAFARQFPQVRLLVTSQTRADGWDLWQLPADVASLRARLLSLWLGPEKGAELERRIIAKGLADTILSGYDLRLVADLAGSDPASAPIPADRIALYRAMLALAKDAAGAPMRLEALKMLAWTMLIERRREITTADGTKLGDAVVKGLTWEGVRILRQVGTLHEFRHDQMRAFLAALWLVEELPSVTALQEAMMKAGAFDLPRRDQEEVWRFLAALLATEDGLKPVWQFANEKPQERGLLLAALQDEADRRNVTLVRPARGESALSAGQ
jgi:hypothetical protein